MICPGCGLVTAESSGPPAPGRNASAGCWEVYGTVLARSYGLPDHRPVHQIVVDAHIAQHPLSSNRREIASVALCLMTLCLFVEDGADPRDGAALHKRMVARRPDFHALAAPDLTGLPTVADVAAARDAAEHTRLVWEWGRAVWATWEDEHATIRAWNAEALGS
ncbi:DUF5946 family protein [Phytomonospora sp. NPDC050363]|uniref:DUF5946 family protein n=1 Tax=Phytomonospora sp. NPDC050363 TaxID=3155642 RepID=UPI0033F01231